MAHVDAYDSYNMILGETSGYIQSSFLDDTGCTETEKVQYVFDIVVMFSKSNSSLQNQGAEDKNKTFI